MQIKCLFTFILNKEENVKKCLPQCKPNGKDCDYSILKYLLPTR